jgi:choline dehydrogenase
VTQSFDYIIVGAGSAGCVLANRLTEDGRHSVLLIEAGGQDNNVFQAMPLGFMAGMADPETDWGYRTEPEPNLGGRQINLPRGRVLGGCSTTNGMIYMRGNARDYDEWRDLGCTGWGHADVLPYFRRMETSWREADQYHGAEGPLSVRKVPGEHLLSDTIMKSAVAAGYPYSDDLSGEKQEGVSPCEVTVDKNGRRASTSKAYLRPALDRRNFMLISGALVTRVLFDGKRAIGVEYRRGMETERASAKSEVILSGGSYNSPQLLMLSGIGPAAHLRAHGVDVIHDSPGVGQNLSEHPVLYAEFAALPVTFLKQ